MSQTLMGMPVAGCLWVPRGQFPSVACPKKEKRVAQVELPGSEDGLPDLMVGARILMVAAQI